MPARTVPVMREEVRRWVSTSPKRLPDEQIDAIINDVMQDISRRADLSMNARTAALTCYTTTSTAMDSEPWDGQPYESGGVSYLLTNRAELPSDFGSVQSLYIKEGGAATYLTHIDYPTFEEKYDGGLVGSLPGIYAIRGNYLFLSFIPSFSHELYIKYFCDPPAVGTDTDGEGTAVLSSAFLTKYWDVIETGVVAEAFKYSFEPDNYAIFKADFDRKLNRMFIQESRLGHSGGRIESEAP